ncbi:hypothetical protein L1887_38864 [Cichorium endivia]|nr:hypothetical protein L1887_38864 [Cichorium endivia]
MIKNPNFQVRKRKWKMVCFCSGRGKEKNEEPYQDVKHPNIVHISEANEGEDSRWHTNHDHNHDGDDGSDADERDQNPTETFYETIEGSENENPSLEQVVRTEEMKEGDDENSNSALLVV